jgi:hypothetical protein
MAQPDPEPVFPVGFDEDAVNEDLKRLPESASTALESFRRELQRGVGLSKDRLKSCQAEGRDGTMLAGCVKTYVPWPDGRFGAVLVAVTHPDRPLALRVIAFGVRHHPRGSNAPTVYEIAHKRLNG